MKTRRRKKKNKKKARNVMRGMLVWKPYKMGIVIHISLQHKSVMFVFDTKKKLKGDTNLKGRLLTAFRLISSDMLLGME